MSLDPSVPPQGAAEARPPGRRDLLRLRQEIPRHVFTAAGVVVPLALLALWWGVTALGLVRPLFLPSPGAVLAEGWRQASEGILLQDAAVSVYRIMIGWLAATVVAVPVGILMGNYRLIEGALEPFISVVRYMPIVALIPLTILWAGIGDMQKIVILFLGTFFQQTLMIMDNVKNIDLSLIRAGQTLGFSDREILRRIILPAASPGIWDTLRITVGWTWTYLVVAELVAANEGLGRRIMDAQRYLATDTIVWGTLFIGFLGLVTDWAFKRAGRRLFRWNAPVRG
ncbi:ABC transporter permease [Rubellimicrobium arenae]|uniref:ABC transporter permease n=1 Tax=Rubellimicrobium arenae TaxID=2817372 RepID=UPI001B30C4ED|nr:ABC transporter permease [Rubellimicrobium arenae]